ncbi:hypothetical protein IWX49DRAFT_7943 [Phyllosticta citricarpa]|uniref:Uncharacterized protein n=2 Tax=Phyllosticta TaxID=121621 RepID=A0ABR1MQG2_9PEZI
MMKAKRLEFLKVQKSICFRVSSQTYRNVPSPQALPPSILNLFISNKHCACTAAFLLFGCLSCTSSPTIIDVWIITEELALTTSSINPRVAFSVSPCSWLLENDSKAHGPPSFSPARPRLAVALINRSNHPPDATIPIYVKGQKNKQAASRQPNSPFCRASEISMAAPKPASHLQQSCSLELLQRRIWKLAGAWRVSSSAVARGSHRSQGSNHCASTLPRRLWNGRRTTTTPIGVTQ